MLHGSWVPAWAGTPARFVIWGETTRPPRSYSAWGLRGARPRAMVRAHPFAPKTHVLYDALVRLRVLDEADLGLVRSLVVRLPSAGDAPLPSATLARGADGGAGEVACWRVDGLVFEAAESARLLPALPELLPPDLALGDDLRFWRAVARLAPQSQGSPESPPDGGGAPARLPSLAAEMPPLCEALSWEIERPPLPPIDLLCEYLSAAVSAPAPG